MTTSAEIWVYRDAAEITAHPIDGISIAYDEYPSEVLGVLLGPEDTPYAGGLFSFRITTSYSYPCSSPSIRFLTDVFHPNILQGIPYGLEQQWSYRSTLRDLLLNVLQLLRNPHFDTAVNTAAAQAFTAAVFWDTAKAHTLKHAH